MRIGILSTNNSWYFRDLQRAAESDHQAIQLSFRKLAGRVDEQGFSLRQDEETVEVDAILVRSMPPGSLEQVVLRMDLLHRAAASGTTVINTPRALECAIDKFLSSAKIQAAGIPTPPTIVCQTADSAMAAYEELGGDVVLKPLFGGEGRGITRLNDADLACRAFRLLEQLNSVIYLQSFIRHQGWDVRILLIGDRVYSMRRVNRDDWRTNVGRGATAEPIVPDDAWIELACRAAAALDTPLAGVDIIVDEANHPYVLEVNAVPGWRALSRALKVDIASEVIEFVNTLHLRASSH